ncbi:iron-siderophore ABC transporter substrate-binding protein [Corynebacterium crudilactis]|uniref:ABC transporter substrate-binding protein n=1 Tax=Corynebacterium crudilactis TaxID=1652495 RepID=A0A172QRN0_9CORY|nr:iron-siderophore ABC transporter substrate-binding protein [Corynebacterium crudilactis]ANE03339.1 ABC transporter substrate-binding protein [Corynebacterium crudilactis]
MRTTRVLAGLMAASLAVSLAACSPSADTSPAQASSPSASSSSDHDAETSNEAFPVTIKHAFGETTIESKPERIATIGWSNHEVALALGEKPVGFEKVTWGDDDNNGLLPWVEESLHELGGDAPILFDATDAIPFEEIANTAPDIILASYSGITQEDYDQLSRIAPVVAYPELAWGTSLDEMIRMNSTALGLEQEGKELSADLDAQVATAMDANPELKEAKPLFAFFDESDFSQIGVYTSIDPRMRFLLDAGVQEADVLKGFAGSKSFFEQVSAETPETFSDVDVIITYGTDDAAANAQLLSKMQSDPLLSRIPAIADGKVVFLGANPLAASANQSPLSIPWGIDEYVAKIAEPLK